jgi:hypothetical protein
VSREQRHRNILEGARTAYTDKSTSVEGRVSRSGPGSAIGVVFVGDQAVASSQCTLWRQRTRARSELSQGALSYEHSQTNGNRRSSGSVRQAERPSRTDCSATATNQEDSAPSRARPTPDTCRPTERRTREQGSETGLRRLAAGLLCGMRRQNRRARLGRYTAGRGW